MKTVSLIGCGALASIFVQNFWKLGNEWKLVNVYGREGKNKSAFEECFGLKVETDFEDFLACAGEYVVELAGAGAVKETCIPALKNGKNYVSISIGALADNHFLEPVKAEAELSGAALYVANGAIGGLDFLQTLSFSDYPYSVSIETCKNPKGLEGSPGLHGRLLSKTEREIAFDGTAQEAIKGFPKNVNVAIATQLASESEQIRANLVSEPGRTSNEHIIRVRSETLNATLSFESKPDKANPKSSVSAALSVLALLKNLSGPIRYF